MGLLLNSHLKALLRPFSDSSSNNLSQGNKIAKSYLYNWGNDVSLRNHVVNSDIEVITSQQEETKCDQ